MKFCRLSAYFCIRSKFQGCEFLCRFITAQLQSWPSFASRQERGNTDHSADPRRSLEKNEGDGVLGRGGKNRWFVYFVWGRGSDFGFGCACVHKLKTNRSGESVLMFVYLGRFVIFCLAPACSHVAWNCLTKPGSCSIPSLYTMCKTEHFFWVRKHLLES